ncbi:hypothetical protein FHK02_2622 [Spirosoma sp. LMG 31448]|uniref:Uncharacterized protein n=1 Tax=Spirosoma utsteinense TaxID=2585773 RepID=A0ABR6W8T7_9BACT|nr:hypothetical protein [Spirosoma utsteinense]MBC3792327.1 hypothetical protein [Spirosoma utsteinense]
MLTKEASSGEVIYPATEDASFVSMTKTLFHNNLSYLYLSTYVSLFHVVAVSNVIIDHNMRTDQLLPTH